MRLKEIFIAIPTFTSQFCLTSEHRISNPLGGEHLGMADMSETNREGAGPGAQDVSSRVPDLHVWFVREVLPLEAALRGYLRNNRQSSAEISDLLQDIYIRVYEAARKELPKSTKSFVFTTAHNLLVNRIKREKVVPLTTVENLEALGIAADAPSPDETAIAREELRRLQAALDRIAPRSKEAIILRQVGGLTGKEIALRMGVTEKTVKFYLGLGIRSLAVILYGENQKSRGKQ